ncbi:pyridoxamine 5'-phosphate oxidase family protein [Pseudaquabacterium pictum]|uniref:General stress protein n=1 Tax=Pseudaquabacterium pictum TaxID=2315236 RepID=A0A480AXR0_9BURK|nr:pyridoxamine 5'-phosphate oxidase family protein [Rubrivivax pictus]GCL64907.1 general stress protein [Rubrivivax pictus]
MSNAPHPDDAAAERDQLWSLIKGIRFALFTTRHGNGHLHGRPMTMQNRAIGEDDRLWFFMSAQGAPVSDLLVEPQVNIGYADPGEDRYVSVSGTAAVVDDAAMKHALWSPMAAAWFPGGADDSDLALVQVRISHASYWDVQDSKLTQVVKMTRAAITGTPPTDLGEHGELRLT